MAAKAEIGTLIVVILKARNLNDKHFYKQDVYAQASISGVKQKTQTDVKGGQHPVWDAELRFQILRDGAEKNRQLEISCFSDGRKDDDLLGKGSVDITETLKTGEFDDWVSLSVGSAQRGEVYLEMTFYSNGPAPVAPAPIPTVIVPSRPLQILQSGSNLIRRPSKLPAHERLARLTQASSSPPSNTRPGIGHSYTGPDGHGHGHSGQRLDVPSPHSSRSSSAASRRSESPLPSLPDENSTRELLPTTLLPAGGRGGRPVGNLPSSVHASPQFPPGKLRPGGPAASHDAQGNSNPYTRGPDPSPSWNDYRPPPLSHNQPSLESNPYVGAGRTDVSHIRNDYHPAGPPAAGPNTGPYYDRVASPQTAVPAHYGGGGFERVASPQTAIPPPYATYIPPNMTPAPHAAPQYNSIYHPPAATATQLPPIQPAWSGGVNESAPSSFAFPVPGPAYQAPPPAQYTPPPPQPPARYPLNQANEKNGLPDPYLQARYQTPLPLPPGASNGPLRGRQLPPEQPETPFRPAPTPVSNPVQPPTKPAAAAPPAQRHQPQASVSGAEQIRVEARIIEEQEEARRRAQEQKDLELALQLDRELNLAEQSGSNSNPPRAASGNNSNVQMRGGW